MISCRAKFAFFRKLFQGSRQLQKKLRNVRLSRGNATQVWRRARLAKGWKSSVLALHELCLNQTENTRAFKILCRCLYEKLRLSGILLKNQALYVCLIIAFKTAKATAFAVALAVLSWNLKRNYKDVLEIEFFRRTDYSSSNAPVYS